MMIRYILSMSRNAGASTGTGLGWLAAATRLKWAGDTARTENRTTLGVALLKGGLAAIEISGTEARRPQDGCCYGEEWSSRPMPAGRCGICRLDEAEKTSGGRWANGSWAHIRDR